MSEVDIWTGEFARMLRAKIDPAEVSVAYVTDTVIQVLVTFDTKPKNVDGGPWLLVHAIGLAAAAIEEKTGNPYLSFTTLFTAAWNMFTARKLRDQKDTSSLDKASL